MPAEMPRTRLSTRSLIVVLLVTGLCIVFTQLPLRTQGRVVEFCTFGDWPLEWAIHRQFERKQPELRSIIAFMAEVPEVDGLTVSPVGLRASLGEDKGVGQDLDRPDILQALISIESYFVNGHEDRISVVLGSEYRGKITFHASYVHPLKSIELPSCESARANDRMRIGYCGIELSADWYLVYQWEPTNPD